MLLQNVGPAPNELRKQYVSNPLAVQPDFLAGLSVAALVIPQGMSYAKIAGVPSVYGLYGAFVPVLCYAALGTSRHLVPSLPYPPFHSTFAALQWNQCQEVSAKSQNLMHMLKQIARSDLLVVHSSDLQSMRQDGEKCMET